jgi:predicted DCC family thiol-disulfide oxidoreductase YuxK
MISAPMPGGSAPASLPRARGLDELHAFAPLVIYDGDCMFCASFAKMYRARESLGPLTLWNARDIEQPLLGLLMARYNLDDGMLFVEGERIYFGADAVHALALVTSGSSLFNRLNGAMFRSPKLARLLYPVLRAGRNASLALRGKSQIRDAPGR